jgi:hypothetical protein
LKGDLGDCAELGEEEEELGEFKGELKAENTVSELEYDIGEGFGDTGVTALVDTGKEFDDVGKEFRSDDTVTAFEFSE